MGFAILEKEPLSVYNECVRDFCDSWFIMRKKYETEKYSFGSK